VNAHSPQCLAIGGGPGHDRCICYCHHTLDTTVTVTKDQLVNVLMGNDDAALTGFRWSDAIFDDLLTDTGHTHAVAQDPTRKLADEGLAGHGLTLLAAQNVLNEFDYWTSPARPAADGGTVRIHKFNEVQPSMERALDRLRALLLAALAKETP